MLKLLIGEMKPIDRLLNDEKWTRHQANKIRRNWRRLRPKPAAGQTNQS
jgi:hypothetical protein